MHINCIFHQILDRVPSFPLLLVPSEPDRDTVALPVPPSFFYAAVD